MDKFFSIKGKEALFISGLMGVFIYFAFLDGDSAHNKFYYIVLGYGIWFISKNIYWYFRTNNIINISKYDIKKCLREIEKIREIDEDRADRIEQMMYYS